MNVRADFTSLYAEEKRAQLVPVRSKKRVITAVRVVSEKTRDKIADQMPVDTGAAVYRWGNPVASDGVWLIENDGQSITQGAKRVPHEYIANLEQGSSKQAPAGFISANVAQATEDLVDMLGGVAIDL